MRAIRAATLSWATAVLVWGPARAGSAEDASAGAADAFTSAAVPGSESALFQKIREASRGAKTTLPPEAAYSEQNAARQQVFMGNREIFDGLRRFIASAHCEVDLQTFVWEPASDEARKILQGISALRLNRSGAGGSPVVVRLLIEYSAREVQQATFDGLWKSLDELGLEPSVVRVEVTAYPSATFGVLHSKSVIVDGRRAMVLTANVQTFDSLNIGFEVRGDVAGSLRSEFDDAWGKGIRWEREQGPLRNTLARNRPDPLPDARSCGGAPVPRTGRIPMLIVGRGSAGLLEPRDLDNSQNAAFLAAFAHARSVIRLMTPNLNAATAQAALLEAVRRGVNVQVVLSKGFNDGTESAPGQGGANADVVDKLYRALAPKDRPRLQIRWFSPDGQQPADGHTGNSHVKFSSFDDQVTVIGSANMDTQSWNHSRELNVVVDDPGVTRAWHLQVFQPAFERGFPVQPPAP